MSKISIITWNWLHFVIMESSNSIVKPSFGCLHWTRQVFPEICLIELVHLSFPKTICTCTSFKASKENDTRSGIRTTFITSFPFNVRRIITCRVYPIYPIHSSVVIERTSKKSEIRFGINRVHYRPVRKSSVSAKNTNSIKFEITLINFPGESSF